MNSAGGSSFKIYFTKFRTCGSQKYYTEPTEIKRKHAMPGLNAIQTHTKYIQKKKKKRKKKRKEEERKILRRIDGQQKRHVSHVGYMYSFSHNGSRQ